MDKGCRVFFVGGRMNLLSRMLFCLAEIFISTFCFGPPGKIIHDFNIAREGEAKSCFKNQFQEIRGWEKDL
jgi:hypothetical protein